METMQELFYRDPYAREFSATVTSCREGKKGFEVVLDDTAFYPEGGGQPSDEGTLGEAKVIFVKRVGPEIVHYIDKPLEVGSTVIGKSIGNAVLTICRIILASIFFRTCSPKI